MTDFKAILQRLYDHLTSLEAGRATYAGNVPLDLLHRILNAGFDAYAPHTGSQPFNDGHYYMDAETFMDQMVAAYPAVFTRLDVWASHAYPPRPL